MVSVSGVRDGSPHMQIAPEPVVFGTVKVGSSINKTVTVSNTGNAPLHITLIGTPGSPFSTAAAGMTCATGMSLAAGGNCSIVVRFAPAAASAYNSSFVISSDGGDVTATLSGTGGK